MYTFVCVYMQTYKHICIYTYRALVTCSVVAAAVISGTAAAAAAKAAVAAVTAAIVVTTAVAAVIAAILAVAAVAAVAAITAAALLLHSLAVAIKTTRPGRNPSCTDGIVPLPGSSLSSND